MLNLFQELVPFSNKRLDKAVSSDGAYSNPVIMSFAFDFTVCSNILETVLYIRNDIQSDCYSNIVVSLMKEDKAITPIASSGSLEHRLSDNMPMFVVNGFALPIGSSKEDPLVFATGVPLPGRFMSNYVPVQSNLDPDTGNSIESDNKLSVKFSYGYDELSNIDWATKHSALCIPNIGYKSQPNTNPFGTADTSYHPVRMRMTWKSQSTLLTIRDYFIDVSYEKKEVI
jgi:hypothetical protein